MHATELAHALQRLAAEATASSPPATPAPAPAPTLPAPITHLSQLLTAEQIAALALLEQARQAAAQTADADVEQAWSSWEANAGMARPQAVDAPAGSAMAAAGTEDHLAWLRPDPADVTDVRYGWGDEHQLY